MSDVLLKTPSVLPDCVSFTGNCDCIENEKFEYPVLYDENDPTQYLEQTTKKIDSYIEEVLKHSNPNPVVSKPCYKKEHTTGLVFLKSYKKHKRTLVTIRQVLFSLNEIDVHPSVTFLTGRKIPAQDYTRIYDTFCSNNIDIIRCYRNAQSKVGIPALLSSLKSHQSTLTVLKNLLAQNVKRTSENVVDQLGVVTPTPI
jgi:hypothetical protein